MTHDTLPKSTTALRKVYSIASVGGLNWNFSRIGAALDASFSRDPDYSCSIRLLPLILGHSWPWVVGPISIAVAGAEKDLWMWLNNRRGHDLKSCRFRGCGWLVHDGVDSSVWTFRGEGERFGGQQSCRESARHPANNGGPTQHAISLDRRCVQAERVHGSLHIWRYGLNLSASGAGASVISSTPKVWNRHAHEMSSAAVPIQNWLYCSIIAPKSGKRRIKLSVVNRPIVQKATTVIK
jgi:hypothetical protein